MKFFNHIILTCTVTLASYLLMPLAHADTTIIILRHAEKPELGLGQLSCRGLNRSLALAPLLLKRYGEPIVIYAPNPAIKKSDKGIIYAYIRPLATIEPLAIRSGLPINIDFGMEDTAQLAQALLTRTEGTQIVSWEHHLAEKLAKELLTASGGDPTVVSTWNDTDFESIYRINIYGIGKERQAKFIHEYEGLSKLSDQCTD